MSELISLDQLQKEVGEWSRRNFPNNKPHHPLLGIIEECGEFSDSATTPEYADAFSDIIIYMADFCERNNLNLRSIFLQAEFHLNTNKNIISLVGRISHFYLKGEQGIRYDKDEIINLVSNAVAELVGGMLCSASMYNYNWREGLHNTWLKVKQRDWQKNPIKAAEIVEENSQA